MQTESNRKNTLLAIYAQSGILQKSIEAVGNLVINAIESGVNAIIDASNSALSQEIVAFNSLGRQSIEASNSNALQTIGAVNSLGDQVTKNFQELASDMLGQLLSEYNNQISELQSILSDLKQSVASISEKYERAQNIIRGLPLPSISEQFNTAVDCAQRPSPFEIFMSIFNVLVAIAQCIASTKISFDFCGFLADSGSFYHKKFK